MSDREVCSHFKRIQDPCEECWTGRAAPTDPKPEDKVNPPGVYEAMKLHTLLNDPVVRELQWKYDALLAENEKLKDTIHNLKEWPDNIILKEKIAQLQSELKSNYLIKTETQKALVFEMEKLREAGELIYKLAKTTISKRELTQKEIEYGKSLEELAKKFLTEHTQPKEGK